MLTPPIRRSLTTVERVALEALGQDVAEEYRRGNVAELVRDLANLKWRLPQSLLSFFEEVRTNRRAPGFVISGVPLSSSIPDTPTEIRKGLNTFAPGLDDATYLCLLSGLGQPFTFDTIQNGNFINDIIPVPNDAECPISSGFTADFGLHTEDAFHPAAGDFLSLLCVRNRGVATTISFLHDYRLSPAALRILGQPRFRIGNNLAHQVKMNFNMAPILYGEGRNRMMRVNFNNISCDDEDREAADALAEFKREAETCIQRVTLEVGDVLIVDNMTTAHGREAYTPRFDGKDRWLKRLYITTRWRFSSVYESAAGEFIVRGQAA